MPDSLGRMTAAEIAARPDILNSPGYQNFLGWYAAGGQHGTLGGKVLNEAAVRSVLTPWGENIHYDAAGNPVSLYRDARAGEVSPYGAPGTGPSAPAKPAAAQAALASPAIRPVEQFAHNVGQLSQMPQADLQAKLAMLTDFLKTREEKQRATQAQAVYA